MYQQKTPLMYANVRGEKKRLSRTAEAKELHVACLLHQTKIATHVRERTRGKGKTPNCKHRRANSRLQTTEKTDSRLTKRRQGVLKEPQVRQSTRAAYLYKDSWDSATIWRGTRSLVPGP